jgi:hypothetical protein
MGSDQRSWSSWANASEKMAVLFILKRFVQVQVDSP